MPAGTHVLDHSLPEFLGGGFIFENDPINTLVFIQIRTNLTLKLFQIIPFISHNFSELIAFADSIFDLLVSALKLLHPLKRVIHQNILKIYWCLVLIYFFTQIMPLKTNQLISTHLQPWLFKTAQLYNHFISVKIFRIFNKCKIFSTFVTPTFCADYAAQFCFEYPIVVELSIIKFLFPTTITLKITGRFSFQKWGLFNRDKFFS